MKRALIGGGGHAREVLAQMGLNLPVFVDDEFVTEVTRPLSELDFGEYEVMIAVGESQARKKIVEKLPKSTKFFSFIHPTALLLDRTSIQLGTGIFIGAYSILTTNIVLGDHCLLNRMNQIGHDSVVGDYVSMMPGAVISGNCNIKNCFYLGTNATVREKLTITENVKVGMNSCVTKDIPNAGVYGGVPAKKLK